MLQFRLSQLYQQWIDRQKMVRERAKHSAIQPRYGLEMPLGFTLAEVCVAMLVGAIFASMTLQAIVTAAAFRATASRYDEAINWIQSDLETVIVQANQYEITVDPYSSKCGATVPANGFAAGFINDANAGLDGASTIVGPRVFGGKSYILTRTAEFATSSDPFRLLQLTYAVTPQSGSVPIATLSAEVFAQAALKCP